MPVEPPAAPVPRYTRNAFGILQCAHGAILYGNKCLQCERDAVRTTPPFDPKRFQAAPCYLCGYNGSGYFQPDVHPCAASYHAVEPTTVKANSPTCPKCGGYYLSIPRMGISHACPAERTTHEP